MSKTIYIFLLSVLCLSVKAQTSEIIGKPVKIGKLLVAQYDFPDLLNYFDAQRKCAGLGNGWRLPSRAEIKILYDKRNIIGFFTGGYYWTSEDYNNGFDGDGYRSCWTFSFESDQESHRSMIGTNYVRAVKSLP